MFVQIPQKDLYELFLSGLSLKKQGNGKRKKKKEKRPIDFTVCY